jgi:hypothetical protein
MRNKAKPNSIYCHTSAFPLRGCRFQSSFIHLTKSITAMKKFAFALPLFGLALLAFTACQKEETPPTFSEQVTGRWISNSVTIDNANASALFSSNLMLNQEKTFSIQLQVTDPFTGQKSTSNHSGNWVDNDANREITLNYNDAPTQVWRITDLTDNGMKASYTDASNRRYEVGFIKQ